MMVPKLANPKQGARAEHPLAAIHGCGRMQELTVYAALTQVPKL